MLLPVALAGYIVGITDASIVVLGGPRQLRRLAPGLILVGALAHCAHLLLVGLDTGGFPLGDRAGYLSVLGASIAILYLVVWMRWRVDALALILIPISAVTVAIVVRLEDVQAAAVAPPKGLFLLHTSLATAGMAILGVAAAMATLYLIQDSALKSGRTLAVLEKLPSLDRCDRLGFQAQIIGFGIFSLGIFTGVFYNFVENHEYLTLGTKMTFALVAWLIFAGVVLLRVTGGFQGRRSAGLVILGFLAGLATVFGIPA